MTALSTQVGSDMERLKGAPYLNTVEALVSNHPGNSKEWSQLELSLTRMGSSERPKL